MNSTFILHPLPKIYFGNGRIRDLADTLASYGATTLLLTGASSFRKTGHWQYLLDALTQRQVRYNVEQITAEPSPECVDLIVGKYHKAGIDSVAAIGGGAVLDAGKAISAMLPGGEPVHVFLEGVGERRPDGRKVPFIAVPTTAGTGSEATSNAVLSRVGKNGYKKSLRHDNYIPDVALIDPTLTLNLPQKVRTNCAMDAFSQLVESYLSEKGNPFTDDLALGALVRLKHSLMRLCRGAGDSNDRINMSYGALVSGVTLSHAGLGVVHGFASEIGCCCHIPHGVVCGTLMAPANEITLKKLRTLNTNSPALAKYACLGHIFSGKENKSAGYYQDFFIDLLNDMSAELKLDMLNTYGISMDDLENIARKAGCKNNPVSLSLEERQAILAARMV